MKFSNKLYDALKWIALIVLPALATFVKMLFPVWNFPYSDQIAATIGAIDFLLGALIGLSTVKYQQAIAADNEQCYTLVANEANELRDENQSLQDEIVLADKFEVFGEEEMIENE